MPSIPQVPINDNKTSRGILEEMETLAYNLQAMADHISDIESAQANGEGITTELKLMQMKELSKGRQKVLAFLTEDVDVDWHCPYKHAINTVGLSKELIQSLAKNRQYDAAEKLHDYLHDVIQPSMQFIRMMYYKIPANELEDESCPKCLSDYLLNKQ